MREKRWAAGTWIGVLITTVVVAYALTTLFATKSYTSNLTKKQVFQFALETGMSSGEVGPGDSFDVSPVVYNDATVDMLVFVKITMPEYIDDTQPGSASSRLYTFDTSDDWTLVETDQGMDVYAYGNDSMYVLTPGESTTALTERMTMKTITNAEYAAIDDINITITGYVTGTENMSADPTEAWNVCKALGDL